MCTRRFPPIFRKEKQRLSSAFISHMDTSPAVSGENVNPRVVAYEGRDIVLNAEKNIVLTEKENPELAHFVGKHLIVTDGNTLLGADDKAGVAEIMTMAQELLSNKNPYTAKFASALPRMKKSAAA